MDAAGKCGKFVDGHEAKRLGLSEAMMAAEDASDDALAEKVSS